jgi:glycosyltransferase involved in cell wall biosynthesis
MPRVSVIMPAYNHGAFVRRAVESVLDQSFPELELLVVDDCSTDETPNVLRSFSDDRLNIDVLARNRGASWAVNSAIKRARGEYIAILNSDDYFLPQKIERQVQYLDENSGVAAVFGLPHFVNEIGEPLADEKNPFRSLFESKNCTREEWLRRFFVIGNCLCHPTVMIRRSCYEELGTYDPRLAQLPDFDLWIRVCSHYDIYVEPHYATAYRVLDGERNASAGQPRAKTRHDWELQYVLRRYLDLPSDALNRIFAVDFAELDHNGQQRPQVLLARLALKIGPSAWASSSYLAFGLDTLHHALGVNDSDISYREYMELTGMYDAFSHGGSHVGARTEQLLSEVEQLRHELGIIRGSSSWRITQPLRFFAKTIRSRNFHPST